MAQKADSKKKEVFVPPVREGKLHDRVGIPEGKGSTLPIARKILATPVGGKVQTPKGSIVITPHDHEMANHAINMQQGKNKKR